MSVTISHFQPSLIFEGKGVVCLSGACKNWTAIDATDVHKHSSLLLCGINYCSWYVHFIESLDKKWVSRATFSLKFGQLGWTRCQFLLLGGSIVTGMLWSFYLVKNNKITNSWTTTKAREKIHTHLELLQFNNFFRYVPLNLKQTNFT